jgi:hypothetical protein
MSGIDGTISSTRVPTVRSAWVPVAMSCLARHYMLPLPVVPALVVLTWD